MRHESSPKLHARTPQHGSLELAQYLGMQEALLNNDDDDFR